MHPRLAWVLPIASSELHDLVDATNDAQYRGVGDAARCAPSRCVFRDIQNDARTLQILCFAQMVICS